MWLCSDHENHSNRKDARFFPEGRRDSREGEEGAPEYRDAAVYEDQRLWSANEINGAPQSCTAAGEADVCETEDH